MPTSYAFLPAPTPSVPIHGSDGLHFPVHRIYCVGRNYAAHAREMGADPTREAPFFFCKPADAIVVVPTGTTVALPYPPQTRNLHHEIELVVAIGRGGRDIAVADALTHVYGYAVGLDMTRRDLQNAAKDSGRPWDTGKAFDHSAPIGPIHPASVVGHLAAGAIGLSVDGHERQRGDVQQMIWSVAEIVAHLSSLFTLQAGDLIYTGTPDGVGAVTIGQTLRGSVEGLGEMVLTVVA